MAGGRPSIAQENAGLGRQLFTANMVCDLLAIVAVVMVAGYILKYFLYG